MRASPRGGYRVAPWLCLCLVLVTLPVPAAQVMSPGAESEKALIDEAKALVTVRILFQLKIPSFVELRDQEKVFQEEWVRRGGEWCPVFPQG